MGQPYRKEVSEVYIDWTKELRQQGEKISEIFDKIIVWIISLATGTILLIFSNLKELQFVSKNTINWTLGFLVLSILLGVIGRILYAVNTHIGNGMLALFELQVRMLDIPPVVSVLSDKTTSEEIYKYAKEDFGFDDPTFLEHKK